MSAWSQTPKLRDLRTASYDTVGKHLGPKFKEIGGL